MRGMGNTAQDKNSRKCKTDMGNGRAAEKKRAKRLIEENTSPKQQKCLCGHDEDLHGECWGACEVIINDEFCDCRHYNPDVEGKAEKERKKKTDETIKALLQHAKTFERFQKHIKNFNP